MANKLSTKVSQESQDNAQSYADEIIKYHQKAIAAQKDGLQEAFGYAIKAGKALILAKENIKAAKGKWLDYLAKIELPQTTANVYERLAENEDFIRSEVMKKAIDAGAAVGMLSIRGALNFLPKRKRAAPKKEEKTYVLQPSNGANAEDEDADEEGEDTSEDTSEESTSLPTVEEISATVCNSGLSHDDLFKVAIAIIQHVVNYDTPQDRLIAYQVAIAAVWPVQQDIQNEAEKHLENMKRAENSPNRLAA